MVWRVLLHICLLSDFRRPFWRTAKHALRHGQIDGLLGAAFMGYHLIHFTREALRGDQNASYYSTKKRTTAMAAVKPPAQQGTGCGVISPRSSPRSRTQCQNSFPLTRE